MHGNGQAASGWRSIRIQMRARLKTGKTQGRRSIRNRISRRERQVVRIMALLRLLAQGRSLTVQELAAHFGTYRQAIYRDLRALQDAGYPIAGDEEGRLSRPRLLSSQLSAIPLAPDELEALLLAARQARPALPNENSLSAALLKLEAMGGSSSSSRSIAPRFESMLETWTCGSKTLSAA